MFFHWCFFICRWYQYLCQAPFLAITDWHVLRVCVEWKEIMRVLKRSKRAGGLGIPDIRRYYRAIVPQRILNWRFHTQSRLWVSLEKCLAGRDLAYAPWLAREHRGLSDGTSTLTTQALRIWDRINSTNSLPPPPCLR